MNILRIKKLIFLHLPTSTHEIKGMETISLQMGWSADNQPQKNVYR